MISITLLKYIHILHLSSPLSPFLVKSRRTLCAELQSGLCLKVYWLWICTHTHKRTKQKQKQKAPGYSRHWESWSGQSTLLSPQGSRTHFRCHSQGRQIDLGWYPLPTHLLCFVTLGTPPESVSTTVKWEDACSSHDDIMMYENPLTQRVTRGWCSVNGSFQKLPSLHILNHFW